MLLALLLAACSDYEYAELTRQDVFLVPDFSLDHDVLFVVDNSASMAEEQDRLAANFEAFVQAVEDVPTWFHLGVVTTDVTTADAGVLRGGVITPDTPDFASAFLDAVLVGTDGSRDEQGFTAALLAMDPERNPGFLREDAVFHAVFLSDEDDHSPDAVDDVLQAMADATGGAGMYVHSIVGDEPDGCASGATAASAGTRYLAATELTGGYRESICADDYTGILTRIGLDVAGLQDTFHLTEIPQPDSIEVWVDDVKMIQRDQDGWTWDPGENAIVFTGRAVPRPNMTVVVEYALLVGELVGTEGSAG